jgi:hypothetical protein
MRECVAKSDPGRSGLDEFGGVSGLKHSRLSGHGRESFYTAAGNKIVES